MSDNEDYKQSIEQLAVYGEIFYQMMNLEWFKEIVDSSFKIQRVVDEETKTVHVQVFEVPPEEKIKRLNAMMREKEDKAPKIIAPNAREVVNFNKTH